MKNLKFRYAKAVNIYCFGEEGIELFLEDYNNVVLVRGVNMDNPGTAEGPASNGSGKSSLQEIFSLGLYNRPVKNPNKIKGQNFINDNADKATIDIQWDNCRVLRTYRRTKDGISHKVQVWENSDHIWDASSEKSQSVTETQKWIENKIGLTHHAFCNVVVFNDSRFYSFLECDTQGKRAIIENLMNLEIYRGYHDQAKELYKSQKQLVAEYTKDYQRLLDEVSRSERRLAELRQQEVDWKETKKAGLKQLMGRLKDKQVALGQSNVGELLQQWEDAQEQISKLNSTAEEKTKLLERGVTFVSQNREKLATMREQEDEFAVQLQEQKLALKQVQHQIAATQKRIASFHNLDSGATCDHCYGTIDPKNYSTLLKTAEDELIVLSDQSKQSSADVLHTHDKQQVIISAIKDLDSKIRSAETKVHEWDQEIKKCRSQAQELLKIPRPDIGEAEKLLELEIRELKQHIKEKKEEYDGPSPYQKSISNNEIELADLRASSETKGQALETAEGDLPYYEYWVDAFGDNGIRKYVIDGIRPVFNTKLKYWLQILIDGKLDIEFDNKFDETITRNGRPVSYFGCSNGEQQRILLAISQSFAYVRMVNAGACPNIVFLDEITGGGIDKAGVPAVYNMIMELAQDRKVFVTTHNETLVNMLQGVDTLTLMKKDDVSTIVK